MENTKRPRHFVYLRTANGTVVRLVCVGECGDGLGEADLFHMWRVWWADGAGCGWQYSPLLHLLRWCCVRATEARGAAQRRASTRTCSHHLWSGGPGRGLCVNLQMIHISIKVCARVCALWSREPSHALRANLPMASSHELMTSILLTVAWEWPLAFGSLPVNPSIQPDF